MAGESIVDADFVSQLLGADQDDPLIRAALAQLQASQQPPPGAGEDQTGKKRKGDDV